MNGNQHRNKILRCLNEWPIGEHSRRIPLEIRPADQQQMVLKTLEAFEGWVAEVILQRALYDQHRLSELSELVRAALTTDEYKQPAIEDAERALKELLSLVTSIQIGSGVDTQS